MPIRPPLPHPSSLQLPASAFDALTEEVCRLVSMPASAYWAEHCVDPEVRRVQKQLRADSRELPNAPARRLYQTQLFLFHQPHAVDEQLQRLHAWRAQQRRSQQSSGQEDREGKEGKEGGAACAAEREKRSEGQRLSQ